MTDQAKNMFLEKFNKAIKHLAMHMKNKQTNKHTRESTLIHISNKKRKSRYENIWDNFMPINFKASMKQINSQKIQPNETYS